VTAPLACPQCAAALRSDAAWCPLCFTRIESGFDPLTAPIEEVLSGGGGTATMTQPVQSAPDALSEPRTQPVEHMVPPQLEPVADPLTDPLAGGTDPDAVEGGEISDIDVMLAMLAAEHRQADPSTEILDRFGDKSTRMVIMVAGTLVVGVVCLGLLALLGTVW